ncbi:site-2 protease family protein [Adhaeribacter rhizoryzae]|uniref:Peptidase M50 domain-containing protein n=1 Tax=Adhaeribacter rhizoryzae TaxID=2607907 RepID=A0A5M6DN64_9BACT|nr:site-2 protease family protein [Adhaeribacter rhizoryzae]KAA5547826.1 hypothetical protein F0145_07755 [Adhaeribacter rhizoryzae]
MFGINDLPKFFLAFFLVLPIISFVHEAGHVFFAWLMGGKNITVIVGTGNKLFHWWILEVREYYFWYGFCSFDNLKHNKRLSNILIFSGGVLFNALAAIAVMYLVQVKSVESGMLTYQFTYFSMYYIFFALLPMPYPDGSYSDGKVILDLIRNKPQITENIYRIHLDEKKAKWQVLDNSKTILESSDKEAEVLAKAHELAQSNRPSRLLEIKNGKEVEICNYPIVPL